MPAPKSMEEHREDLRISKEAYERSPTYYNYIAIQRAQKAIDTIAALRRKEFVALPGYKDWK